MAGEVQTGLAGGVAGCGGVRPWFEEARRWPRTTMAAAGTLAGEGVAWGGGEVGLGDERSGLD